MSTLDIQRQGMVARVFLNRPEVRNAFNDGVIAELTAAFRDLGADPVLIALARSQQAEIGMFNAQAGSRSIELD